MSDFFTDQAKTYLSSIRSSLEDQHGITELIFSGLSEISSITKTATDDTAVAALRAVYEIVRSLGHGIGNMATPNEVRAQMAKVRASLESNDQKHDADLVKRFDDGAP